MSHTHHLTLYWVEDKRGSRRRFGFVTSKKVGKAHDRNLVRRRLRDICHHQIDTFHHGDYIWVARPGSASVPYAELKTEVNQALCMLFDKFPPRGQSRNTTTDATSSTCTPVDALCDDALPDVVSEPSTQITLAKVIETRPETATPWPVRIIRTYQGISRLTPSACRFHPTCSEYMAQSILRYGTLRGILLGIRRIMKCHPFSKGGHDPVQ